MLKQVIIPGSERRTYTKGFRDLGRTPDTLLGFCRAMELPMLFLGKLESSSDIPSWLGRRGVQELEEELVSGEANNERLSALERAGRIEFHFDADKDLQRMRVTMTVFLPGKGRNKLYRLTVSMSINRTFFESSAETALI